MLERMFRELKQRQGGIHVISSKRASLRESTKDLLAQTVKFGQDNRQANPCSDKTVQVGYHSLELIPNSTSRYEGIDNRERRCIMLALRCSRNAASRSRHAASRPRHATSAHKRTFVGEEQIEEPGAVGEPPPPKRLNHYASPIDKTIDDSTQ